MESFLTSRSYLHDKTSIQASTNNYYSKNLTLLERLTKRSTQQTKFPTIEINSLPFPLSVNKTSGPDAIYENLNILDTIKTDKDVLACQYTEDKKYIAAGFLDGTVSLFDRRTKELTQTFQDPDITARITAIKCRPLNTSHPPTNSIVTTYENGIIKFWNFQVKKCLYTVCEKRKIFGLTYHPFLPKIVTYGDNDLLYYYDEERLIKERVLRPSNESFSNNDLEDQSSRIYSVCFNPNNSFEFVSGGNDSVLYFWDTRLPKYFRSIKGPFVCGNGGIDIANSGKEIVTFSWRKENQIQIWDYGTGKLIETLIPDKFNSYLYCGKFLHKNFIICGGMVRNIFRLINLQTQKTVSIYRNLPGAVFCLDVGVQRRDKSRHNMDTDLEKNLPMVIFCSGKLIYEIDFGF